jgi:type 2A phosphatase activator TIP41
MTTHQIYHENESTVIKVNEFCIKTIKKPIFNKHELEGLEGTLSIPAPEMLFGNNRLELQVEEKIIYFDAVEALKLVQLKDDVKVSIAAKWTETSKRNHEEITKVIKPYDWTFTTKYKGTCNFEFQKSSEQIDQNKLMQKDPIIFYDDVILYEDELGDNGCALLHVRVRVMSTTFLILSRFFLRVDHVLVRIIDTRLYHEFGNDFIIREFKVKEISMDRLIQVIQSRFGNDQSKLTDMNLLGQIIDDDYCIEAENETFKIN